MIEPANQMFRLEFQKLVEQAKKQHQESAAKWSIIHLSFLPHSSIIHYTLNLYWINDSPQKIKYRSLSFLLSQTLSDIQTDLVIEKSVVELVLSLHLSHFTGDAASSEIQEDYYPIDT